MSATESGNSGIGCGIGAREGHVNIVSIVPTGPAALSQQIAVGDIITAIDGTALGGDKEKAVTLIPGKAGSPISLSIKQQEAADRTVVLIRQPPLAPQNSKAPAGDAGVGLALERQNNDQNIVITKVAEGGAAAISGIIKAGDILVSVDEKDVSGMACRDVAPLLLGSVGTRVTVTVKRGEQMITAPIVRAAALEGPLIAKAAEYAAAAASASGHKTSAPAAGAAAASAAPANVTESKGDEGAEEGGEGEDKKKKPTKGEAKAAAYAAKLAAKAAKEAELAEKAKNAEPKKEKKEKKAKEEEVIEDDNTPPGEKKSFDKPMAASYNPKNVEAAWDLWWEKSGYYRGDETSTKPKYVIMLPPPNVTGTLHIGHALTASVQDTIARWRRMSGFNVLWLPGTDHAGIATQVVVEKKLKKETGQSRHDLGREKFIEEVWKWKEQSCSTILMQLRRMGSSLDWSREAFTMDAKLSKAVLEAFLRLHKEKLIYRAQRLVNWDSQLKSAVSDLEVDYITLEKPEKLSVPGWDKKIDFGMFWEWAYKVEGSDEEIVIATTRPETMLGDTAVAVHPEDPRYKSFHGKFLIHPILGRRMPVILDADLVDMEFGTGAVKVTPAHDPNDFVTGQKHKLEFVNILNDDGTLNSACGSRYNGMHRFQARYEVIKDLKEAGLYKGNRPNPGMRLGLSSRTKDVIEPVLKPQWWVDCKQMAADACDAVTTGKMRIIPAQQKRKWYDWLENIRDWCISRQLWWGHRIPAYYTIFEGEERTIPKSEDMERWVVASTEEEALKLAKEKYPGKELTILQDEDVLDTWFSSGLFPFSTLGWPDETADLKAFYPNSLLETGWDILFFWVARMVMMGMKLVGEVPFSDVFLHAMVRDAHGRKMSKSLGNVIDPIDVIEGITLDKLQLRLDQGNLDAKEVEKAKQGQKRDFPQGIPECGTDALRFALCAYTSQGGDINLNVLRVEGYRHFGNKLWNATKFAMTHLEGYTPTAIPRKEDMSAADRWILHKLTKATAESVSGMEQYDFAQATTAIYSFFLYDLCDVYLEVTKPIFANNPTAAQVCRTVLHTCLERGLRLLHPFMPFITEELWQRLARSPGDTSSIMVAPYPQAEAGLEDEEAEAEIKAMQDVVSVARSMRDSYGLKPSLRPVLFVKCRSKVEAMKAQADNIKTLVKCETVTVLGDGEEPEKGCGMRPCGDWCEVHLVLKGMLDLDAEISKLEKSLEAKTAELKKLNETIEAPTWEKVPQNVKDTTVAKKESTEVELEALKKALVSFNDLKASQ